MFKVQNLIKIVAVEAMMFGSFALTAQAVEPTRDNSSLSANSPILVSQQPYGDVPPQSYGEGSSISYEQQGDYSFNLGEEASDYGDYTQAYDHFRNAANYYAQCYQEMKRQGDTRTEIVVQKYNQAQDWLEYLS